MPQGNDKWSQYEITSPKPQDKWSQYEVKSPTTLPVAGGFANMATGAGGTEAAAAQNAANLKRNAATTIQPDASPQGLLNDSGQNNPEGRAAVRARIPVVAKAAGATLGSLAAPELLPETLGPIAGALARPAAAALGGGVGHLGGAALGGENPVSASNLGDAADTAGKVALGGLLGEGLSAGLKAIPSAARAGATLGKIRESAGNEAVDMTKPGNTALDLYTQSQRGATLPKAVRDFVMRATKPDSPPLTYSELKDFQSNISNLSAQERMNLKPNLKRLVGQLNADMKDSLEGAALRRSGLGTEFRPAMREYSQAKTIENVGEKAKDLAIKTGIGGLAGLGSYRLYKALQP